MRENLEKTELWSNLMKPADEFTPIPFWFWNDMPDKEKIEKQLKDYREKGVNGIVLHPRIGIPKEIEYLSESFFEVVGWVIHAAKKLDMKIVLYDEGMYPSGSAHGMVVRENPSFAARGITITTKPGSDPILTELSENRFMVVRATGGTIRGIHFGEDDNEAGAPLAADILNSEAVDTFIRLTHEQYYKRFGAYFGTTIIGFFTDEPCPMGRNVRGFFPWSDGMKEDIIALGGKLEELEGLFTGTENRTTICYKKLLKRYLREVFYARLSKWCEKHHIALMGHPAESDDIEEELYFHVPGQDLIMRRVSPETGGLLEADSVQAKVSADIARHLGRRRNSNECFGVCCRERIPWYFTGRDMKWYIDWLAFRGVNLFIPHAFYYSVEGERSGERPPDVGPNNIWWKYYRQYSDYMKRLSFLMTDSKSSARIAILCDNNRVPVKEAAYLYENQIEFHYLPVMFLKNSHVEENILCVGEQRYDMVWNILGEEEWASYLKGVHQIYAIPEQKDLAEYRTVDLSHPVPTLRAVRLEKEKIPMYLFSNEGMEEIQVRVSLPESGHKVCVDLWKGTWEEKKESEESENIIPLSLRPCETKLVIVADFQKKPHEHRQKEERFLGDLTEMFEKIRQDQNQIVYQTTVKLEKEEKTETETFEVCGEEMAECFCNGEFVGTSFWSPHRFDIGEQLREGENQIEIRMTGNAANLYQNIKIPFGMDAHIKNRSLQS